MTNIALSLAVGLALTANSANAQQETAAADAEDAVAEAAADAAEAVLEAVEEYEPVYPMPPRLRSWRMVKPLDYPLEAWRNDEEGIVDYAVEVDAQGKPTSCEVTKSSGSKSLDDAICPIVMERGEFRPGMAEPDEPIAATYEGYHNWRKQEPEMPQMSIVYRYTHGANGESSSCEFLKLENIPERMREEIERDVENGRACNGPGNTRGIPYRDEDGNPIEKVVTVTFDVVLDEPAEAVE